MTLIIIVSVLIFLVVSLTLTQFIYSDLKHITIGFVIAILLPICLGLLTIIKRELTYLNACYFTAYYFLLLFIVKVKYNRINEYLISKGLLSQEYSKKDFTFVSWDGDLPGSGFWWNKKLSSKPSTLDTIITVLILILPVMLFSLIHWVLRTVVGVIK